jgi:hypothetical protein
MHDLTNPRTLVLDLGTATTKSGWTDFGEPDLVSNTINVLCNGEAKVVT